MPRGRLTYANVVATIALFVALGGSSYAAIRVTGKQVKDSSLTSADVRDRSLLKKDFKPGQLPRGAAGAQGLKGDPGSSAPADGAGSLAYKSATIVNPAAAFTPASVACDPGQRVVGGGIKLEQPASQYIIDSAPNGTSGWTGTVNGGSFDYSFTITAICAGPGATTQK